MTTRILLSTTSYQDTPGPHHALLESQGFEIVRERGPLPEKAMLELAGEFDAFLCGDDAITRAVIDQFHPRLKVISKYGIGLDKIDVAYATEKKLPVLNTPGVCQNLRSAPQKQPRPNTAVWYPSGHGPCSGLPFT